MQTSSRIKCGKWERKRKDVNPLIPVSGTMGEKACITPSPIVEKKKKEKSGRRDDWQKQRKNKGKKTALVINILHYNCQGLTGEGRILELEKALEKIRWDIVSISEMKREGVKLIRKNNGNLFFLL